MRLWSLHPGLLDRAGLVAGWREALLAQAVLAGRTKGYRNHPQLHRFIGTAEPVGSIGRYLIGLAEEADRRGYRFDRSRINQPGPPEPRLQVSTGQLDFERDHLRTKLLQRSPDTLTDWTPLAPHPLFTVVAGPVADWERP